MMASRFGAKAVERDDKRHRVTDRLTDYYRKFRSLTAHYPILRIARVTDPPHSSIISTALRLCSSVQLGIRELLTGPIRSNYLSASPFASNATTRCPTMAQPSQPAGLLSSAQ